MTSPYYFIYDVGCHQLCSCALITWNVIQPWNIFGVGFILKGSDANRRGGDREKKRGEERREENDNERT